MVAGFAAADPGAVDRYALPVAAVADHNPGTAQIDREVIERYLAAQGVEDPRWIVYKGIPPLQVESTSA